MSNIVLTWTDPTTRADGSALPASEFSVNVLMRVVGSPSFAQFSNVGAGVQTETITDLPPGDYEFLLQVADTQTPPRFSQGVVVAASVPVPVKAQPSDVTNAAAAVV